MTFFYNQLDTHHKISTLLSQPQVVVLILLPSGYHRSQLVREEAWIALISFNPFFIPKINRVMASSSLNLRKPPFVKRWQVTHNLSLYSLQRTKYNVIYSSSQFINLPSFGSRMKSNTLMTLGLLYFDF